MNKKFIVFLSSRKSWTLPYIIFSAIFVVIPLVLIVVYAFTDDNGHLTLANFQKFFEHPEAINTFVYSNGRRLVLVHKLQGAQTIVSKHAGYRLIDSFTDLHFTCSAGALTIEDGGEYKAGAFLFEKEI